MIIVSRCTVVQRNISERDFAEILRMQRMVDAKLNETGQPEETSVIGVSAFDKALRGSKLFLKNRNLL